MGSRNVVKMFLRTLFFGGLAGLITSFFVKADQYRQYLSPFDFKELAGVLLFFLGLGLVFSVVSQTGFFAYLFIHRFGLNLFRSYWSPVQIVLIAFVLFDLVYFPYIGNEDSSLHTHVLIAAGILAFGLIIAFIKAKETNKSAFIPALFLMVVMTTLEWVPGLRTEGSTYKWLMIVPLLVSNAYQIIMLHRLQEPEKIQASEERRQEKAKKKEQKANANEKAKNGKSTKEGTNKNAKKKTKKS
ncbi:KinB-signaling pathway activation protein [Cerasibacillus terrae]|uniref:KinB-signaling pathway activation protein n=1 Tax=Cerasibacillus terrae TaxID=2498845 RepID=A0A5C8NG78_9BACI|nr:KinB-signaling pathway activation protein [Cerasibacillus terrae]